MQKNNLASFNVVESGYVSKLIPKVSFEVSDESTLQDMFEAFKNFLLALGYVIPPDSYIDLVEDEYLKIEDKGLTLLNETEYRKGM